MMFLGLEEVPKAFYTLGGAAGLAGIYGLAKYFFVAKKDIKHFDAKVRDELWEHIKRQDEQIAELRKRQDELSAKIVEMALANGDLHRELREVHVENAQLKRMQNGQHGI